MNILKQKESPSQKNTNYNNSYNELKKPIKHKKSPKTLLIGFIGIVISVVAQSVIDWFFPGHYPVIPILFLVIFTIYIIKRK